MNRDSCCLVCGTVAKQKNIDRDRRAHKPLPSPGPPTTRPASPLAVAVYGPLSLLAPSLLLLGVLVALHLGRTRNHHGFSAFVVYALRQVVVVVRLDLVEDLPIPGGDGGGGWGGGWAWRGGGGGGGRRRRRRLRARRRRVVAFRGGADGSWASGATSGSALCFAVPRGEREGEGGEEWWWWWRRGVGAVAPGGRGGRPADRGAARRGEREGGGRRGGRAGRAGRGGARRAAVRALGAAVAVLIRLRCRGAAVRWGRRRRGGGARRRRALIMSSNG